MVNIHFFKRRVDLGLQILPGFGNGGWGPVESAPQDKVSVFRRVQAAPSDSESTATLVQLSHSNRV